MAKKQKPATPQQKNNSDGIDITTIRPHARNPRRINDAQFAKLCESVRRDPEFMRLRPIIVDEEGNILGGNMRYRACVHLGIKTLPAGWVIRASDLTPEQRRRFVIVDNAPEGMSGEWDDDILGADWEIEELAALGMDVPAFDIDGSEPPEMPDGDRQPFRQISVILHDEQYEEVMAAMNKAKELGHGESAVNENTNGNALAFVCQTFNRGEHHG